MSIAIDMSGEQHEANAAEYFNGFKPRQHPQVGDSIEIKHEVKRTADGTVLGLQRNARSDNTEITVTYLDGTVATGRGDVWEVKLSGGRCKWETVNNFIKKDQE